MKEKLNENWNLDKIRASLNIGVAKGELEFKKDSESVEVKKPTETNQNTLHIIQKVAGKFEYDINTLMKLDIVEPTEFRIALAPLQDFYIEYNRTLSNETREKLNKSYSKISDIIESLSYSFVLNPEIETHSEYLPPRDKKIFQMANEYKNIIGENYTKDNIVSQEISQLLTEFIDCFRPSFNIFVL